MRRAHTHVIGAGIAGLAAAVALASRGQEVTVYEAASIAGGRCRSFRDAKLGRTIDNGNHLLLSGNRDAMRFLSTIGAANTLTDPPDAIFPFVDVRTKERWQLQLNRGRIPWRLFSDNRLVASTKLSDYLSGLRLAVAGTAKTVTDCVGYQGTLYERFWEPLTIGALNITAHEGSARLLWSVLRETVLRGKEYSRPCIARTGLSHTFVDPALAYLIGAGAGIRFGTRLRALEIDNNRVRVLHFVSEHIYVDPTDAVVLAVPEWEATQLVPSLRAPAATSPIVNVHFVLPFAGALPDELPMTGIIGGTVHWVFVRGDVASVTISAANALVNATARDIATITWPDVATALNCDYSYRPPYRVIKEKRATFAQRPTEIMTRPSTRTHVANLFVAGAFVDTGLPATIEGAARSGHAAARAVMQVQP